MQKFDKPDPATLNGDDTPAESDAATPADEANAAAPASAADPGAAPAEAAAIAPPAMTPVAPPIVDPNSNADTSKAVQDRITQMQQMFAAMTSQGLDPSTMDPSPGWRTPLSTMLASELPRATQKSKL